ncbi:hypothetical protein [Planktothrix pseudagardhii]|uniref:DNA helicase n=1 Tax=Planktothrix pseudagardhii TaxID=132604 RepID=A0A9W4G492_9CYAN|nr:hypothetical protein [Planktothrix pseudagardhii]CAD5940069.1 DNA helicase [Planktothrix pseudagardhii]
MLIYTTPTFDAQAKQQGIQSQVAELLVTLKAQGTVAVQALFEWNYPYLKRPIRNLRLLGKILWVKNDPILCLLAVFPRGGKEYEAFLRNPDDYGRDYLDTLIDQKELDNSINAQREEQKSFPRRPSLPEDLRQIWLKGPDWIKNTTDAVICESEIWVAQFKQRDTQLQWRTYYDIVDSLVEGKEAIKIIKTEFDNIEIAGKPEDNRYILYSWILTSDIPNRSVLFLLSTFDHHPNFNDILEVGQITRLFNFNSGEPDLTESSNHSNFSNILAQELTLEDLARYTRRSYPDYLLGDSEIWLEIEQEFGINWALSMEEEKILHELSTPELGSSSLPVFINGRAGSGKSTMLFYLFADYCYRYQKYYLQYRQKLTQVPHPLFLTYNEQLLGKAKEGVEKLLKSHHKFLLETNGQGNKPSIDVCFKSFQQFLLSLLPPEESDRFDPDKYICFHEFRQRCGRRYSRYSPELCWHIIRTFIKGYTLSGQHEGYMTPDDYQEVPRRERSLSVEIFQAIYKQVWPWYYQLTTREGYWDDQDLIRKVLEVRRDHLPLYTAIFCDEAQDFTSLELRLIMQLSIFSHCDLYPPVWCLPFAFAGDPFQTLNPTGFRWESVKATFFDQVIAALDPTRQLNLTMTFYELESNYRSSPSIVKVTNLIHLWRHILFKIQELKPQESWQSYIESPIPQKFIFGQNNFSSEALKKHIEKSPIFIVPCEAGGELDYIRRDEFLSPLFPDATEEHPPKNILSAIQAKGLEFPLVILYKFGDQFAKEFNQRPLIDYVQGTENHPLELEYFFNKLYVAASRGMSDLVVIDTEMGDRYLWQYATVETDPAIETRLGTSLHYDQYWLTQVDNRENWETYIGGVRWGDNLEELQRDNRASQAQEFEENGRNQKDATSMRRAKQFYRELGYLEKADICEAFALKFDKRFREAGRLFLKRSQELEAWDCFWDGMCWQALAEWYRQFPQKKQVEQPLVEFMAQTPKTLPNIRQFTQFLEESLSNQILQENRLVKAWKAAVQDYSRQIRILMREKILDPEEWQRFAEVLEGLDEAKYNGVLELAGDCYYRARNLRRAVRCWQDSNTTQKREYNIAQAELSGFPEGLPYLEKAGDFERMIVEWEKSGKSGSQQWLKHLDCLGRALERQNRLRDWIDYLIKIKRWIDAIAAIEKCSKLEAILFRFELLRQIARSNLTPEQARDFRSRYLTLIEKVLSSDNWRQKLTMVEVGITLEKIGELVPTLKFYERFINCNELALQDFARERWLATKLKQKDYALVAEPIRAEEIHQDIIRKSKDWKINPATLNIDTPRLDLLDRPELLQLHPGDTQHRSDSLPDNEIQGLPPGTKIRLLGPEADGFSFQIGHIQVKRAKRNNSLWVLLTDIYSSKALQIDVDGKQGKVRIGELMLEVADGHQLSFNSTTGDYRGVVFYRDEKPRVELHIRGISSIISL